MTTAFELASAAAYDPWNINEVGQARAVYNGGRRVAAFVVAASVPAPVARVDHADFSVSSAVVAAALSDEELQLERIAALRQSIANGTYRISADVIAGSILKAGLNGW